MHWLASYPKSGNTWIELFIEHYVFGNTDFNSNRSAAGDQTRQMYHTVACCELSKCGNLEMLALREAALHHVARVIKPWTCKTHHANVVFHERALIPKWITHGAIYVMRDPRDVVVSKSAYMNTSIDRTIDGMLSDGCTINFKDEPNFFHYLGSWKRHVESWITETAFPVLVVRYEDLVNVPHVEFKRIIEFHPWLEYDAERVQASIEATSFSKLQQFEKEHGFLESKGNDVFFRRGTVGQWTQELTGEQLDRLAPLVEFYNQRDAA